MEQSFSIKGIILCILIVRLEHFSEPINLKHATIFPNRCSDMLRVRWTGNRSISCRGNNFFWSTASRSAPWPTQPSIPLILS
jgi:hypothetical protein